MENIINVEGFKGILNQPIIPAVIIIGIIFVSLLMGPMYIVDKVKDLTKPLINTATDRISLTVAENKQPFFREWASNFGPESINIFGKDKY